MKKHATLLIKNIAKVYTMQKKQGKYEVLTNAYIAIHHDEIIAVDTDDYEDKIESDTRIIDGRGHICVPGFIELDMKLPDSCLRDAFRLQMEICMKQMKYGTLTFQSDHLCEALNKQIQFERLSCKECHPQISYPFIESADLKTPFCISGASNYGMQTQLMAAQLLFLHEKYDALTILKALTLWPAEALNRKDIGRIHVHGQADLVLFGCCDLESIFSIAGNDYVSQVIKKGIRIFPNILIS